MAKTDDRSEAHLTWLVRSRSENQSSSLRLFLLINQNPSINRRIDLQEIAQALTAVAFPLWRTVFLSDLIGDADERMADLETFLGNLISNNTVAYQQDKNAREFTFLYYLTDAELRLRDIAGKTPTLLTPSDLEKTEPGVKADWTLAQKALDLAIVRFGILATQSRT